MISTLSWRDYKNIVLVLLIVIGCLYTYINFRSMVPLTVLETETPLEQIEPEKKLPEEKKIRVQVKMISEPKKETPKPLQKAPAPVKKKTAPQHQAYTPTRELMEKGRKMLGDKGQKIGSFPRIVVDYKTHLGIRNYLNAMDKLGGRFYILDKQLGRIVARLDVNYKKLVSKGSLRGMSPRSRVVTHEKNILPYLEMARQDYGPGNYDIILLVPLEMDQYLISALENAVNKKGELIKEYSSFMGVYVERNGDFYLGVDRGVYKKGGIVPLNVSIKIGR